MELEPGSPKGKDEITKLIMLGWTMLKDSCPDCKLPLVENSTKTRKICVKCRKNFKKSTVAPGVKLRELEKLLKDVLKSIDQAGVVDKNNT